VAFTYDPTTPRGQVRLLAIDTQQDFAAYTDADIDAFLTLSGSVVLLAAAQALDTTAANAALTQGKSSIDGVMLNGEVIALALHTQAMELRRQFHEADDGSGASPITWAEMVVDEFTYRNRLINEMLRQQG
jgi:hypothetical protein